MSLHGTQVTQQLKEKILKEKGHCAPFPEPILVKNPEMPLEQHLINNTKAKASINHNPTPKKEVVNYVE